MLLHNIPNKEIKVRGFNQVTSNEACDPFCQQMCNSVHVVVTEVLSGIIVVLGDRQNVLCDRWIPNAQRVNEHNNDVFIKYD